MNARAALRLIIATIVVGLSAVAAKRFAQAVSAPSQSTNSIALKVLGDRLDFGDVVEQSAFRWVLPIQNTGRVDLHIERFNQSCSCSEVSPESLRIPAGETREVTLTLDLRRGNKVGELTRPFEAQISPIVKMGGGRSLGQIEWTVRGTVHVLFVTDRTSVEWGRHSEDGGPLTPQFVNVRLTRPVGRLSVRSSSQLVTATLTARDGIPEQYTLRITGPDRPTRGPLSADVILSAETSDGRSLPSKSLTVHGDVVPDCDVTPVAVALGARPAGEVCTESVTVESLTGQRLSVVALKVVGAGLTAESNATQTGGIDLLVKQVVGQGADNRIELIVRRSDGTERTVTVLITHRIQPQRERMTGGGR